MKLKTRRLSVCLVGLLFLLATAATPALAQISFTNFNDVSGLALNGSAAAANNGNQQVLRLTPDGTGHVSGTAWFATKQQSVSGGFTSAFQFQITHDPNNGAGPADGMAFVIQNSTGDGFGTAARGGSGGAIGYGVPDPEDNGIAIPNSLAIEFDTYQNGWDPNANHIAVQSCGVDPNTQDHTAICPDGSPANLGIVSDLGGINLADGAVHTAVIEYDPGTLKIYIDNLGLPVLTITTDLSHLLTLSDSGNAWVGFTGSTGGFTESNDILNWTFSPANTPTPIDQNLNVAPPDQQAQTNYLFGSYNHKLQYENANSGDNVNVTAIPIDPTTFHDTRLSGTPFSGAQCVPYGGAGGNCVLFEVTCTQTTGSDCTDLNYDLFNNFDGPLISGACVLKATIGQNNWQNIIETFTQGRDDGGGKSGSKGFSDFIFGQNCSDPPSATIASPANGSTVILGQSVTISFSCAPPDNAPLVTVTSCSGLLNGNPVNNGDMVVFNQIGPQTLVVTATDSILDTGSATSNFTVGQVPGFTSGNSATFQVGVQGSFQVTTTGSPAASITETGALPSGLSLVSHGDGTATLSGTPAANTGGVYNITLFASNSAGNAMQSFTLTVLQTPAITSPNNTAFQVGVQGSFTVTATGYPIPGLTESGALPGGVGFIDNGNGTGTLSGKPTAAGTFNISFTATNTAGSSQQYFTLTVSGGVQVSFTPTSINFGNVKYGNLLWQNVVVKNTGNTTLQISKVYVNPINADWDDFNILNLCPKSLPAGKSCLVTVFFFADELGQRTATLNFTDNAPNSPQQIPLSGNVTKH
ncbi:MAG: choice-of-anchor D domain-containing protein [Terriglobales bacterium]